MRPNRKSRILEMAACCALLLNTDVHLEISNKTSEMSFALPCKLLPTQQPSCLKMLVLLCISNAITDNFAAIYLSDSMKVE